MSLVKNWELKKKKKTKKTDNAKVLLFAILFIGGQLLKWGPGKVTEKQKKFVEKGVLSCRAASVISSVSWSF